MNPLEFFMWLAGCVGLYAVLDVAHKLHEQKLNARDRVLRRIMDAQQQPRIEIGPPTAAQARLYHKALMAEIKRVSTITKVLRHTATATEPSLHIAIHTSDPQSRNEQ